MPESEATPKLAVTWTWSGTSRRAVLEKACLTPSANSRAAGQIGRRQEHGELLAAEPSGNAVAVGRRAQQPGKGDDDLVADGVAEHIVDGLEMIEIGDDDRRRDALPGMVRKRVGGSTLEAAAVEQPGQRIGVGLGAKLAHDVESLRPQKG